MDYSPVDSHSVLLSSIEFLAIIERIYRSFLPVRPLASPHALPYRYKKVEGKLGSFSIDSGQFSIVSIAHISFYLVHHRYHYQHLHQLEPLRAFLQFTDGKT